MYVRMAIMRYLFSGLGGALAGGLVGVVVVLFCWAAQAGTSVAVPIFWVAVAVGTAAGLLYAHRQPRQGPRSPGTGRSSAT